jgi:hypothetical protein
MSTQGFFKRPMRFESMKNCAARNAGHLRPFGHGHGAAVVSKQAIASLVSLLGFPIDPSAILGAVRSISVDAVKRIFARWARPHIGEEVSERFPAIADTNATPAVIVKHDALRITTAAAHALPDFIFRSLLHAVRGGVLSRFLAPKASTTARVFRGEVRSRDNGFFPAVANAKPRNAVAVLSLPYHQQSIEASANKICERRHSRKITQCGFSA